MDWGEPSDKSHIRYAKCAGAVPLKSSNIFVDFWSFLHYTKANSRYLFSSILISEQRFFVSVCAIKLEFLEILNNFIENIWWSEIANIYLYGSALMRFIDL